MRVTPLLLLEIELPIQNHCLEPFKFLFEFFFTGICNHIGLSSAFRGSQANNILFLEPCKHSIKRSRTNADTASRDFLYPLHDINTAAFFGQSQKNVVHRLGKGLKLFSCHLGSPAFQKCCMDNCCLLFCKDCIFCNNKNQYTIWITY